MQAFLFSQKQFYHIVFSSLSHDEMLQIPNTSWYCYCLQFNPPVIVLSLPSVLIWMKHGLQQLPLVQRAIFSTTGIKSGVIKDLKHKSVIWRLHYIYLIGNHAQYTHAVTKWLLFIQNFIQGLQVLRLFLNKSSASEEVVCFSLGCLVVLALL